MQSIEHKIEQVKKFVPISWPLQNFIAGNPLFDLTDQNFNQCIRQLNQYADIRGSLGLDYYHNLYHNGSITIHDLNRAIEDFGNNIANNKLSVSSIANLLTNIDIQHKLERLELHFSQDNQKLSLLSKFVESSDNYIEQDTIKFKLINFCNNFFDLGQTAWQMPIASNNLFTGWCEYNKHDNKILNHIISSLPNNSIDAIDMLITKLGIPDEQSTNYMISIIFQILGWSSFVKWLETKPNNPYITKTATIADIIAIWLTYEFMLAKKYSLDFKQTYENLASQKLSNISAKKVYKIGKQLGSVNDIDDHQILELTRALDVINIRLIWQRSYELHYQEQLINSLKVNLNNPQAELTQSKAQAVFCIDTRSEGFRRYLERIGEYETFGFAGFFGIDFKLHDDSDGTCTLQCPAIVDTPNNLNYHNLGTTPIKHSHEELEHLFKVSKNSYLAPFMLFDILGIWYSLALIGKTIIPNKFKQLFGKKPSKEFSNSSINVLDIISDDEQSTNSANYVDHANATMNLLAKKTSFVLNALGIKNFAQFVIICGHISESDNNPFQSSLDCGACGGNGGIPNAIAFCQILNNVHIRTLLKQNHNISIPSDSYFVSACHNTTTDRFSYYNLEDMNKDQHTKFLQVIKDFKQAGGLLSSERLQSLYGSRDTNVRKSSWAELIPELGLANNAAFIVAPRHLSKGLNLGRRAFLNSYDYTQDPHGEILKFILNAPVIVGHFINSQYYFSTTDKLIYGAGNKAIHNVTSGFIVMEGNFSDFKIGLPLQCISFKEKPSHQPLRLLVVIYAPKIMVDDIIAGSQQLQKLFNGGWMHLCVIEPNV